MLFIVSDGESIGIRTSKRLRQNKRELAGSMFGKHWVKADGRQNGDLGRFGWIRKEEERELF